MNLGLTNFDLGSPWKKPDSIPNSVVSSHSIHPRMLNAITATTGIHVKSATGFPLTYDTMASADQHAIKYHLHAFAVLTHRMQTHTLHSSESPTAQQHINSLHGAEGVQNILETQQLLLREL
jgi:hypothetical protein